MEFHPSNYNGYEQASPLVFIPVAISSLHHHTTVSGVGPSRDSQYLGEALLCKQTYGFMPCSTTALGNLFLIIVYGYLTFVACKCIFDGSEMLRVLGPGCFGQIALPKLDALPSAILILVSGLSGPKESAQSQVFVGMGLLAGSTVMLLTVIWASCIIVGKHDIEHSVAEDGQNAKGFSLTETGVCTDISTCYTARIMAISVIPFIVVQLPRILHSTSGRNLAVLIALIVSVSMFIAYCLYQCLDFLELRNLLKVRSRWEWDCQLDQLSCFLLVSYCLNTVSVSQTTEQETTELQMATYWCHFSFFFMSFSLLCATTVSGVSPSRDSQYLEEALLCKQAYGFMPCSTTALGNLFLISVYGYLTFVACKCFFDGSEMLKVLGPGCFGQIVLPKLDALTSAVLILVSGLSGTKESAQSQVLVGMGFLAGSTVMLLTVVWGSCIVVGKCDIEHSVAKDGQNTKGFSLTETGVSTDIWTCYTARIMAVSVIPFIVVQIPQKLHSTSGRDFAVLIALILSVLMFIAYCLYQPSNEGPSSIEDAAGGRLPEGMETNQENQTCDVENPKSIYFKAVPMLIIGTIIAAAFAHPLEDAVTNFSNATSIPPFFVSFIALPMTTKLSVAVPLLTYASHKRIRSSSLAFTKLYATVSTDNVIYLSALLAIVYIRGLSWDYSAEVLAIAVVCILVGGFASVRTTFPLWSCLLAYMLYPLSLALVYVLDYVFGWAWLRRCIIIIKL
ncbi:sodium/calcium exchanger NCL-like [Mangifera indica]|uniref:sodium/calcium exchanger NCL-like n=1 Tax=Mangifera indica TaxID=29780 RepID=UPI001CFA9825|nr:sodium/calcium exchanger NCL-like [Mangifera indica]